MVRNALLIVALGITGGASVASLAYAGQPQARAPAAVAASNWTGFYAGGHAGAAWTSGNGRWDPLPNPVAFCCSPIAGDLSGSGFIGGIHGGYNWQFNRMWVAGIEADWSWGVKGNSFSGGWITTPGLVAVPGSNTTVSRDVNWLTTIRGRFGYLVNPDTMLYFTGGAAWGNLSYSASACSCLGVYRSSTSFTKTSIGYVLGGGLEWAFTSHWHFRGEYLFYDLDSSQSVVAAAGPAIVAAFPSGFSWSDARIHVVRAGLNYKF